MESNQRQGDVIKLVYSICDKQSAAFSPPFVAGTHGEAMRSFQELVRDKQSLVGKYPEDYVLYCIGSFNMSKGMVTGHVIEHVAKGIDFIQPVTAG